MSTFSEELHCIFDNSLTNQQKPLRFGMLAHNLMYFNIIAKKIGQPSMGVQELGK